jgi:Mrp family chromosome partitioning ATPase
MIPGWQRHVDASVPMSAVILPMGSPRSASWETMPDPALDRKQPSTRTNRFAFPAIPHPREELLFDTSPRAIWPTCDCTEVARAGVKLANAVWNRLPLDRPSVLALTSPGDGDGKTTLAAILAPELAKRTPGGALAVDADFRKADLTSRLAIPAAMAPVGASLIYPTDRAGLSVLPMSYQRECRGADAAWIEEMRENWPLTLLDMASLEHAETAPVLRHCDGVCLVVRLGHTARRAVSEAARVIAVCGGRLLGCVVVGEAA